MRHGLHFAITGVLQNAIILILLDDYVFCLHETDDEVSEVIDFWLA